mmetsp:Transcript_647/g.2166  ORF Transcript_647/g.2166 Transcript_647/m.2166 type:complete len:203 (+) Transcript_647:252-860(+)
MPLQTRPSSSSGCARASPTRCAARCGRGSRAWRSCAQPARPPTRRSTLWTSPGAGCTATCARCCRTAATCRTRTCSARSSGTLTAPFPSTRCSARTRWGSPPCAACCTRTPYWTPRWATARAWGSSRASSSYTWTRRRRSGCSSRRSSASPRHCGGSTCPAWPARSSASPSAARCCTSTSLGCTATSRSRGCTPPCTPPSGS